MPNKPSDTHYSELRYFVEWQRGGKLRIKRLWLPGLAAWIIVLANRYERTAKALDEKRVRRAVPGMEEAAKRMRYAVEHLSWLVNELPQNFDADEWTDAVREICEKLGIQAGDAALVDVGPNPFAGLIEVPADGSDESGSGEDVQLRGAEDQDGAKPARRGRGARRSGTGGANLAAGKRDG